MIKAFRDGLYKARERAGFICYEELDYEHYFYVKRNDTIVGGFGYSEDKTFIEMGQFWLEDPMDIIAAFREVRKLNQKKDIRIFAMPDRVELFSKCGFEASEPELPKFPIVYLNSIEPVYITPMIRFSRDKLKDSDVGRTTCKHGSVEPLTCKECKK